MKALPVIGRLLLLFSAAFTLPIVVAVYYGEDIKPFAAAAAASLAIGSLSLVSKTSLEDLRFRDAFAFVALSWLAVSFVGSLPYVLYGVSPVDAFFESISGFTTTGASVLTPEELPKSLLFWRSMTQWLGGMGIIVLFLAVFPSFAKKAPIVFQAEYPGVTLEKLKPRIKDTALLLYGVYALLSAVEILLLLSLGVDTFDAVVHTFSTISTGGFSSHSESVAYFDDVRVEAVVAFFAFLGGTNFALIYFLLRGNARILRDAEFRAYVAVLLTAILLLTLANLRLGLSESLRYSAFQAVSIMTTTGFTTCDFDAWNDSARFVLLILMFVGGCSGSTAGGIKVIRIYLLLRYSIQRILKAAEPRTVRVVKYGEKTLSSDVLENVSAFFVLYILIFVVSSLLIALSGYDILTSISATAATLGNVGPGMGLAGAAENYASFPVHVKVLLCMNMWVGRLEIFTVLALFIPSFWKESW